MPSRRGHQGAVEYEVNTSVLDEIIKNLGVNTSQAVRATAFAIEGKAKKNAPVDTGALANSIYVRVGGQPAEMPVMTKPRQIEAAEGKRVELPEPENNSTAHVGPSVEYALYQELGTNDMAAHPFLGPAVNASIDELTKNLGKAVTNKSESSPAP